MNMLHLQKESCKIIKGKTRAEHNKKGQKVEKALDIEGLFSDILEHCEYHPCVCTRAFFVAERHLWHKC